MNIVRTPKYRRYRKVKPYIGSNASKLHEKAEQINGVRARVSRAHNIRAFAIVTPVFARVAVKAANNAIARPISRRISRTLSTRTVFFPLISATLWSFLSSKPVTLARLSCFTQRWTFGQLL
jgi:hypothetical protein